MSIDDFFVWLRSQKGGVLLQSEVDAANILLLTVSPKTLKDSLSTLAGWSTLTKGTSKKLSKDDVLIAAFELGVEPAALKAVIDIEAASSGFDEQGRPTILFERHKMWSELTKIDWIIKRDELAAKCPDICSESSGAYNARSPYEKLRIASELNWDVAHKSASWGLGQVMGFHAISLGYTDLKEFIDAMHESEAKQLDAMCRFIKVNKLASALKNHNWAVFAKGYNGSDYAKNKYDLKLAAAYEKAKKEGY